MSNLLLAAHRRRPAAPPPVTFNPTAWSGCTLDLVAEDCPVASNPCVWTSRVGSHGFSASGAFRPVAGTLMNGKATIRFSGAQRMVSSSTLVSVLTDIDDWTVFMVLVPKAYTSVVAPSSYLNGDHYFGDGAEFWAIQGSALGGGQVIAGNYSSGYAVGKRTVAVDTPVLVGFRGRSAEPRSWLQITDQPKTSAFTTTGTTFSTVSNNTLPLYIGGGTITGRYGNFEVARIFAYNRAVSDVEYAEIVAAVQAEYGLASQAWTPNTPEVPNRWLSVELGRIWQDTAGTIAATAPGQPVARIDAINGSNFTQAGGTLQPYLATLGDGFGVRTDDVDDNIGVTESFTAGAKTLACIFEIYSAPSTTGNETILRVGATPQQIIVRHSGLTASSAKGFHFAVDRSSATGACIQPTGGAALLSNGIHTLVLRYDGTGAASAAAYRAWLDGVEVSLTTGGNVAASGNSRWLATSVPSEPCNSAVRAHLLFTSALSAEDCAQLASFLEGMRS